MPKTEPEVTEPSVEPEVGKLSSKDDESFIATGIKELDGLVGGLARGRITELWGAEGVGKTYTVSKIMAHISKDHTILFVDTEYALNKQRTADLGAVLENIDFLQDSRLERVAELLIASVGQYDVIVLDSLAYLTPKSVDSQEVGENAIGLFARQIKHWVVKFRPRLGASKTAFVVVNQYRKPFGMYAKAEPPGGTSWNHAVDVRIHMTANSADKIMDGTKRIGHYVNLEVKKSKVSVPFLKSKFKVEY